MNRQLWTVPWLASLCSSLLLACGSNGPAVMDASVSDSDAPGLVTDVAPSDVSSDSATPGANAAKSDSAMSASSADAGCIPVQLGPLDPEFVEIGKMLVTENHCQQCHGSDLSGNNEGVALPG